MDTLGRYGLTRYWAVTAQAITNVTWGNIVSRVVSPPEQLDRLKAAEIMLQVSQRSVVNVLLLGFAVLSYAISEVAAVPVVGPILVLVWLIHTAALLDGLSRVSRMNRAAIRQITRVIDQDRRAQRARDRVGMVNGTTWDTGDLAVRPERESWARPRSES